MKKTAEEIINEFLPAIDGEGFEQRNAEINGAIWMYNFLMERNHIVEKTVGVNPIIVEDNVPRRSRQDLYTPSELAISNAMAEVEKIVSAPERVVFNVLLTDAVILLGLAKDKVSDFIEAETPTEK